jgi:hypothetical protein
LDTFPSALQWIASRTEEQREELRRAVHRSAQQFSLTRTAEQALALYESLIRDAHVNDEPDGPLTRARRRIDAEWKLLSNVAHAAGCALDPSAGVTAVAADGAVKE